MLAWVQSFHFLERPLRFGLKALRLSVAATLDGNGDRMGYKPGLQSIEIKHLNWIQGADTKTEVCHDISYSAHTRSFVDTRDPVKRDSRIAVALSVDFH